MQETARRLPRSGSGSVLVVEDNADHARSLALMLEAAGFASTIACNGVEALALLSSSASDLAFVDLHLPDIDGLELLSRIEQRATGTRSVLVTASVDAAQHWRALDAGARFVLVKPVHTHDLRSVIQKVTNDRLDSSLPTTTTTPIDDPVTMADFLLTWASQQSSKRPRRYQ